MLLHISLQLVFRIARTADERIAVMIQRTHDGFHELIVRGMFGPIFVIGLVMRALRGGMRQDELDLALGAEVKQLCLATIDEYDGIKISTHNKGLSTIGIVGANDRKRAPRDEGYSVALNRSGLLS